MSKPYRLPQVEEQTVLDELEIQEVGPEDYPRFQSLLRRPGICVIATSGLGGPKLSGASV